jgi:putative SOS response-associated peptidase YedK
LPGRIAASGVSTRTIAARWVLLADIHDRMPVILRPEHHQLWLDPGFTSVAALAEMLRPFDAGLMKRYPVSARVNTVSNDDAECAAAVTLLQVALPLG